MRLQLDGLERHGELVFGRGRYSPAVRGELLAMSAATIDRYLAPAKAKDQLKGKATTKPSPLLRSSIKIRKSGDEIEAVPGFFEGDTVAHCGPTLKGEFARSVNLTCVHTGWTFTRTVRNNAHTHILSALNTAVEEVPFEVVGLDFDNGTEFLNKAVIAWAGQREIFFTRSRPYKKNDQATVESKNNHLVRKYAFYYRYDTPEERTVLNRLWPLVNDRLNYLTPTIKPIGYASSSDGRRRRLDAGPGCAGRRLLAAGVLSPAQQAETDRLPRQSQPCQDRPPDRRPAKQAAHLGQRKNRAALPHQHPHRPARRPQRHPDQSLLNNHRTETTYAAATFNPLVLSTGRVPSAVARSAPPARRRPCRSASLRSGAPHGPRPRGTAPRRSTYRGREAQKRPTFQSARGLIGPYGLC